MIYNDIKTESGLKLLYDMEDGLLPSWLNDFLLKTGHEMLKFLYLKQTEELSSSFKENVLFDAELPRKTLIKHLNYNDCIKQKPVTRKKSVRPHNYTQKRYPKLDNFEMRFRMTNDRLQPAVIANNPAKGLYHENMHHVELLTDTDNNLYMKFTKKLNGTYSPKNNPAISRLCQYGKNKKSNEITTFVVTGVEFQKSILKFAQIDVDKLNNNDVITLNITECQSDDPNEKLFKFIV